MSGQPDVDMDPRYWAIVRDALGRYLPGQEVWAFGSRARKTAKPYSDLDIAVITVKPLPAGVGFG